MQHLWQMCLQGSRMMSQSSLNPSMQMGHVLELFFMINVLTLFTLGRFIYLWAIQGNIAISDISFLFKELINQLFFIYEPSIIPPYKQKLLTISDTSILLLQSYQTHAFKGFIFSIPRLDCLPAFIIFSQRMNKNREVILENPFHPLDLSPHDLLTIYKRFEESRVINRNPKQELPIETISQLISSLKGCPPSYVQKCISQALIKDTISWNQFLSFLDQESEIRQQILQWLMYQKTVIKYKLDREWPIRSKISTFFQQITFLRFIELNENDRLMLCCIDNLEYYLLSEVNSKITIIDHYKNKSERISEEKGKTYNQDDGSKEPSKMIKNDSKIRRTQGNKSSNRSQKNDKEKIQRAVYTVMNSAPRMANLTVSSLKDDEDDQTYFRKERKNINSLFGIWKELNLDHSIAYANAIAPKISERNINQSQIAQLKDIYSGVGEEKLHQKKIGTGTFGVKPLQKAVGLLKDLHRQKRALSYNPYAPFRSAEGSYCESKPRKVTQKERKQREYAHEGNKQAYNDSLKCLAVVYYNMDLVLIKVMKEFNKISLEQHDKIKIITQSQHKKNEVIEAIDFYYHSIVNKWFLIVLIRVEFKNEFKTESESYIRGYQINLVDNKRRGGQDYRFAAKKEAFTVSINDSIKISKLAKFNRNQEETAEKGQEQARGNRNMKNQIFKMEMQMEYGIHFITVGGKYLCIKEDYQERVGGTSLAKIVSSPGKAQDIYFSFYHEQKFKNAGLSLSCLSVSASLSKMVFGTIRGMIIVYDMFSHYFKIKKVSNTQIVELKWLDRLVYILTLDEKLIIMDITKLEEVQHISIRNEVKLHQKIKQFQIHNNVVYFFGTEMKSYSQFVNEELQHQQRKMEVIYKWRLDRLFHEEATYQKGKKKNHVKEVAQYLPRRGAGGLNSATNVQMVIVSQSYFMVLTEILELVVLEKKSLKIKFTMILGIPHDSKVIKMALSPNEKLIALLLFNQHIVVFNIHTQDQYQNIKPSPYLKYTTLTFLDLKNQYLLATGVENGKIMLSPYNSIPEKSNKMLQGHKKSVTFLTVVRKECLVSCGEDFIVTIWLLPFNVLKHQVSIGADLGYVLEEVGVFKDLLYLKTLEGAVVQINTHSGKMGGTVEEADNWVSGKVDACTGQIMGATKASTLQVLTKGKEGWQRASKCKIDTSKSEIRELCLLDSEKVVIFLQNGTVLPWLYQGDKFSKSFNICQEQ